jgi:hypothetical protein
MAFPTPEPGARVVTLDDVYAMYREFLGRDPDYATEALPRVGNDYLATLAQIRCSQEAANYRANHGAEPDSWCFNRDPVTGRIIPGVPPPPPQPPVTPPPPKPPGSDLPIIGGIIDALWPPIQEILAKINAIAVNLGNNIGETLRPILEEIVATGGRITQTLADNITQLIPAALNLAAEAANRASDVAAGFIENAATVGDVARGFIDEISKDKPGIVDFIFEAATKGFGPAVAAAIEKLELDHMGNTEPLLDLLHRQGVLPPTVADALSLVPGRTTPLHLIVGAALLFAAGPAFLMAILGPELAITTQANNERAPNLMISANDAAQVVARSLRDYGPMEHIAKRNGYNADQFRVLADLAFQWPAPEVIAAAQLRGVLDPGGADVMLNRRGLNAESRAVIRAMALQLPGVQDTIRMAVREVFDPQARQALTLDADYPPVLTDHARRIGLSEDWARNFWAAHWELPGPNQVFEMLHRRLITLGEVDAYLKAADYAPVWRQRLREIAYSVFTRVDIRRIHDLRGKDHGWLVDQHKRLGYNDADAEELSAFVELLNDDERALRRKELTGPLVGRIITNVVNGTLNDTQATEFFSKLGYRPDAIDTFLTEASLIRNEQRTEKIGELLGDLFVKGRRTRVEAATQLRERGFTDAEIETRLRQWDLEKELRAPTEKEEQQRDLTRSDIEAMYRARQLPRSDAERMLIQLRYDATETKAILDLDDFKEKQSEDRDRIEVVHRKFVKGTLDKPHAEQELGKIGLRATQIEASLARWELEISSKTAELSVGQIGEVYKLRHWDDEKTRAYLARIGYDEDEISALLRTWGSKIEERRKREEDAARRAEEARKREAQRIIDAAKRKEKDLGKTDLLNAGAAGTLTWAEVRLALVAIGYSLAEADILIRTKQQQGVRNA